MFSFFLFKLNSQIWVKGLSSGLISWSLCYLSKFQQWRSEKVLSQRVGPWRPLHYWFSFVWFNLPWIHAWTCSSANSECMSELWVQSAKLQYGKTNGKCSVLKSLCGKLTLATARRQKSPKHKQTDPVLQLNGNILQFNGGVYWTSILFIPTPNVSLAVSIE